MKFIFQNFTTYRKREIKKRSKWAKRYTANVLVVRFTDFSRGSVSAVVQL